MDFKLYAVHIFVNLYVYQTQPYLYVP